MKFWLLFVIAVIVILSIGGLIDSFFPVALGQ